MSKGNLIPKARTGYLLKMAAEMAVLQGKKYLSNNPESKFKTLLDQADTLVNHVGRLKGAAMKAVQTLSIEGSDFLPPEVIQVLEQLQSQAPPVDNQVLMDLLKSQLGEEKIKLLENISAEPIAAASIGQVYSATYRGQEVVVKVQYPGVAESVDSDIDVLKKLIGGYLMITQKKIRMDQVLEEARRVLKLETNYLLELESLEKYRSNLISENYVVPKAFRELSTEKVLVLSREDGVEFSDWVRSSPNEESKIKVAKLLLDLYIKEFFESKFVQTDPNPANFLINKNSDLVLLDFGATLDFENSFVKSYQELVRRVFSKNRKAIQEQVIKMGFLDNRENQEVKKTFVDFLILSMVPFEPERQPFDFGNQEYSKHIRNEAVRFSRMLEYSAPPKDLMFLHRKLGGIFMLLKKLNIKADLSSFRRVMLEQDF